MNGIAAISHNVFNIIAAMNGTKILIKMLDSVNGPTIDGRAIATTSTSPSSSGVGSLLFISNSLRRS